ncbi:MAG: glycosyltransferase family 2 protein [Bacteroidetes bacterium]|nr:glycosyltransferase family 2 protein [Bacteroidota bacterium]
MASFSVVIVAKNEAAVIARCIQSVRGMTDDILVCDTGSTDGTPAIAQEAGARTIDAEWMGYGKTKNHANSLAKYDWILQLDADEYLDGTLQKSLLSLRLEKQNEAYRIRRRRFFKGKIMRFGAWGREKHIRLFHRNQAAWNDDLIHESLNFTNLVIIPLQGFINDQTYQNDSHFQNKMKIYAEKCAQKYLHKKVKGSWWRQYLSPVYTFCINYLVRLGFLDGYAGLSNAWEIAVYTRNKYVYLYRMEKGKAGIRN